MNSIGHLTLRLKHFDLGDAKPPSLVHSTTTKRRKMRREAVQPDCMRLNFPCQDYEFTLSYSSQRKIQLTMAKTLSACELQRLLPWESLLSACAVLLTMLTALLFWQLPTDNPRTSSVSNACTDPALYISICASVAYRAILWSIDRLTSTGRSVVG